MMVDPAPTASASDGCPTLCRSWPQYFLHCPPQLHQCMLLTMKSMAEPPQGSLQVLMAKAFVFSWP